MILNKYVIILICLIALHSCKRNNELIIIYENSSDFAMKLQVTLNGEVIDTIQIDKFKTQKTQKSIRKSYQLNEESKFDFKELNTGISISKKINSQNEFKCFILLGQNGPESIEFDTISKKNVPDNI